MTQPSHTLRSGRQFLQFLAGALALALASCGGGNPTYAIGGAVVGLPVGSSVVLQDTVGDTVTVTSNTGFVFPRTFGQNTIYNITVATQPSGATCTVFNGTGVVLSDNVANIAVNCGSTGTTGSTAFSALSAGDARIALVPRNLSSSSLSNGVSLVPIDGTTHLTGSAVATGFAITSCSTDSVNLVAVCMNYFSATVAVLDLSKFATTLNVADIVEREFGTGVSGTTRFSGVTCTLCGVIAVPALKAFIVSASDGYRVYAYPAAGAAGTLTPSSTYAIPITENFAVSNVLNALVSPDYSDGEVIGTRMLRVVNLDTGKAYAWTVPTDLCVADNAACSVFVNETVDAVAIADDTGVVTLDDELGDAQLSIDMSQAVFNDANGTFTAPHAYNNAPGAAKTLGTFTDMAGMLSSSVGHWGYTVGEFGDAFVGVQQLPASGGAGGTFTLADPSPIYLDLSLLTSTAPCTSPLLGGFDPHAQGYTATAAGTPLGLFVSDDSSCVAAIDFAKLYAAPRQASPNANLVDLSTYDPVAAGAVTLFAVP